MKQQLIIFAVLLTCSTNIFGQAVKCIDQKGRAVYSNTQCPDNTRLEKSVGSPGVTVSPINTIQQVPISKLSAPNEDGADIDAVRLKSRHLLYPYSSLTATDAETQSQLEQLQYQQKQLEFAQEMADDARQEAEELVRQEAEDRAREETKKAEHAAEDLRYEMLRSSIRTKNSIYLGVLLLAIGGFVIYFITRNNKEKPMDENQKYGVVTMIVSFLLILLALMISEGWTPQLDYLENLMNLLKIQFFFKETTYMGSFSFDNYLIDISTKYVVLILLSTAAYGLTTYLGITPAFMPWKKAFVK